jgi:hypothetical protein
VNRRLTRELTQSLGSLTAQEVELIDSAAEAGFNCTSPQGEMPLVRNTESRNSLMLKLSLLAFTTLVIVLFLPVFLPIRQNWVVYSLGGSLFTIQALLLLRRKLATKRLNIEEKVGYHV